MGLLQDDGCVAREMAALIDGIENGHAPLAGAQQAIEAMEVALGMLESAEKGKVVILS